MRNPSILQTNNHDEETATLETLATNAGEERINTIRRHLHSHLELNPQSTYVSWIATLHPEDAAVMIDPRFYTPGNQWLTVYEETKASIFTPASNPIHEEQEVNNSIHPIEDNEEKPATKTVDLENNNNNNEMTTSTKMVYFGRGGMIGLDKIAGPLFVLVAIVATLILEIHCTLLCVVSNAFLFAAKALGEPNLITDLIIGALGFVGHFLALADLLILLVSVFVVEVLAIFCAFVCFILSCFSCRVGSAWHQSVRRVSHLIRWAFRSSFQNGFLSRHSFLAIGTENNSNESSNDDSSNDDNSNDDSQEQEQEPPMQPDDKPPVDASDNHVSVATKTTTTTNKPDVVVVVEDPQKRIIGDMQPVVLPHAHIDKGAGDQHTVPIVY